MGLVFAASRDWNGQVAVVPNGRSGMVVNIAPKCKIGGFETDGHGLLGGARGQTPTNWHACYKHGGERNRAGNNKWPIQLDNDGIQAREAPTII